MSGRLAAAGLVLVAQLTTGCGRLSAGASGTHASGGTAPHEDTVAHDLPTPAGTAASALPPPSGFRLHGTIEPARSRMVTVPRLTGTGIGSIVIVQLAKAGTAGKTGGPVVEFDRAAQIKTAHDREAEYRDFVEQIHKKQADQAITRAKDDTELVAAVNAVRSAELDMLDNDLIAPIKAEENSLALEEARA